MRDVKQLHPLLQYKIEKFLKKAKKEKFKVGISECYRTVKEQNDKYEQGRSKPGSIITNAKGSTYSSQHQWGVAFDIYRDDGKGTYNEAGNWFRKVAKIAKSVGLGWGGDWTSILDKPHFYLKDWGSTTTKLKQQYGSFENFKKTWEAVATDKPGTHIRKTRLPKAKILRDIPHGEKCDVLYKKRIWSKVEYKGTVGFARNKFLK
jgi:peptidoglycan L-alanyl-D-glutamate endopeptidase CwlK